MCTNNPPTSGARRLRSLLPAVVALAATLATTSAVADAPPTGPISARLALRNSKGQVGCALFNAEKGFPDGSFALQTRWCSANSSESVCTFDPVPAGTYAIACFHDENKNGKLDTGTLGIPTEGTAASNDAKGFMGPPTFKNAKFSFSGSAAELRMRMRY
jgi:uncharacterized protein (DUF2141 family)